MLVAYHTSALQHWWVFTVLYATPFHGAVIFTYTLDRGDGRPKVFPGSHVSGLDFITIHNHWKEGKNDKS